MRVLKVLKLETCGRMYIDMFFVFFNQHWWPLWLKPLVNAWLTTVPVEGLVEVTLATRREIAQRLHEHENAINMAETETVAETQKMKSLGPAWGLPHL